MTAFHGTPPKPPYYAVVFTSRRPVNGGDGDDGYGQTAVRMVELAQQQPGYLGADSARGADGEGITVSYWQSLDAITAWREQSEHLEAQARGKAGWYEEYDIHISRVERSYGFSQDD